MTPYNVGVLVGLTLGLGEALTVGVEVADLVGAGVVDLTVGVTGFLVAVGAADFFFVGTKVLLGVAMVGTRGMVGEMKMIFTVGSSGTGEMSEPLRRKSPITNTTTAAPPMRIATAMKVRLRSSIAI